MKINLSSRSCFIAVLLLMQAYFSMAQSKIFMVNSGEAIIKGVELHDKRKYKEAIAEYQKVPENDTNFVLAMYELALSARSDSQLTLAKSAINSALAKLPNEYEHDLYTQMGSVYDEEKKLDSGLIYFNRAIQRFPNSSYAYHAKGINLTLSKNFDSAVYYFQKAILMNPYSDNSHYFLGLIAHDRGYPVQAMMSYAMYLILSPNGARADNCIAALYSLANLTDNVIENINKRKEESFIREDYSEIETFYKAKIALDKKYKIDCDIDDNIFRQLHLICEKLPEKPGSFNNFWESYYAPIYKGIRQNKFFNPACLLMISGLNNDAVKKKVSSEKKSIEKFSVWVANELNDIGYHRSTVKPVDKSTPGYFFEKGYAIAKGKMMPGDEQKMTGEWEYYLKNGTVFSRRNFTAGKLNGLYETFYFNGKKKFSGMVVNDKAKGESVNYYENGIISTKGTLDDDKKVNEYSKYFTNGNIYEVENYRNGILEGKFITNYNSGGRRYEGTYQNGILDGQLREFYEIGRLSTIAEVKKGKGNGTKTEYYLSGAVYSKSTLKDGERDGPYTSWYENGAEETKENYKNGKLHGKCAYYHRNGKLKSEMMYDDGVQDGASTTYDDEGRIHFKDEFKKGHLAKIVHYNVLTGNVEKENLIEDRQKNIVQIYNTTGVLLKEAVCDRDGSYNGPYKEFFVSGALRVEKNYEKGNITGKSTVYYEDGKIEKEINYKDAEPDGLFVSYHSNGKKAMEGMYAAGEKQGYWYSYNDAGVMYRHEYFINGKYHGNNIYYRPNGKLQKNEKWEYDELLAVTEYDSSGKLIRLLEYPPGQTVTSFHYNAIGKKLREFTFANNYLQGSEKGYYPDGSIAHTSWYKNGIRDSVYTIYHSNGQKAEEGIILNGDKHGAWKSYTRKGQLESTEYFHYGDAHGNDTMYSHKGTIETIIPHKEGKKTGWVSKYALNGDLLYKLHYIDDLLIGYTYQSKTGELMPEVRVEVSNKPVQIKTYFKNGTVSADFTCTNGKFDSKRTLYHPNGKVFYEISFDKGITHGPEKEYHENGQLFTSRTYSRGEYIGTIQKFNDKGQLMVEDNYFNGYRHGPCKYFDDNGKLSQTITFYWGEMLDLK